MVGYLLPLKLEIRPDIRYPAFRIAGYPGGRISGKFSNSSKYLLILV